jgi:hypothetical protein
MSDEHFTVDGTLIEAWASQKSFQRKDGAPTGTAATFGARSGRMTRIPRPATRMPGCTANRVGPKPAWPVWAIS